MNRIIRFRLSIIAVLFMVPMTFLGCTQEQCETMCEVFCYPTWILFGGDPRAYFECFWGCTGPYGYDCETLPGGSLQGFIDSPDECAGMFELYQAAIDTCEAYPDECAKVLDSYAQSVDTDAEE